MIGKYHLISVLLISLGIATNVSAQYFCNSDVEIPPTTPTARFTDNGDGTVTDKKTGLMWAKCAEGLSGASCATGNATSSTWQDALNLAATKSLAGYNDWRLPNVKELLSIIENQCVNPAINLTLFPNTPSSYSSYYFWSSSRTSSDWLVAWYVNFYGGYADWDFRDSRFFVRLVRSGQ